METNVSGEHIANVKLVQDLRTMSHTLSNDVNPENLAEAFKLFDTTDRGAQPTVGLVQLCDVS